jgi:hypothetical protein
MSKVLYRDVSNLSGSTFHITSTFFLASGQTVGFQMAGPDNKEKAESL